MTANPRPAENLVPASDWADAAETRVLNEALRLAPTLRWNGQLAKAAAKAAGLSEADAMLLLPKGPDDLAALLFRRHDAVALATLAKLDGASLKVRERIHTAVSARIEAAMADEAAVRCASAYLATPLHGPLALSLGWATADKLWRWAGDTATDENHYSKRAILSAVLFSTLAARLSGGKDKAEAHLKARIDNVMAFEKWKAGLPTPVAFARDAASLLGRLRYGARTGDAH
jgi:ubiquinone biosynthesis protein COQ9